MSNRLIWLIIILLFLVIWTLSYLYLFVYYTWNLEINSTLGEFKAELYSKDLYKTFKYNCKNKDCKIEKLSPLNYELSILKEWYVLYKENIKIPENKTINLKIELKKDIKLVENKTKIDETTNQEKINKIKSLNSHFAYFFIDKIWNFYFDENQDKKLDLSFENTKIWTFEKAEKQEIRLEKIYNSNYFYLEIWNKKIIYNLDSLDYKEINLKIKIDYIKRWINNIFLIKTDKWTFTYDFQNEILNYFSLFSDFVYYENWYIAVVKKDDLTRINNLWLENNKKEKIIYFDIEKKEKKLLFESDFSLNKIVKIENNIIFFNENNQEYSLNYIEIK